MIKVNFDKKTIEQNIGIYFEDEEDYIEYIKNLIYYLAHNNRNYNDKQYNKIIEIAEILSDCEVVK